MVEKVEDKEFKRIQATGKYVVLKCVKIVEKESVIKTAGGIIIPGQESKNTGRERVWQKKADSEKALTRFSMIMRWRKPR